MRVVTVVGVRPQFVKASLLSRELRERGHEEILVHTGQHYDPELSAEFFDELNIPEPDIRLDVGSSARDKQIAQVIAGLRPVIAEHRPDWVVAFGDANSTAAAARAARSGTVPLVHVEAGLRSFNSSAEEQNRVEADRIATVLLCPSDAAVSQLASEGISSGVHLVGDLMADVQRRALGQLGPPSERLSKLQLEPQSYVLATIHRAENTDDESRLSAIMDGLGQAEETVLLAAHPRLRKALGSHSVKIPSSVRMVAPMGYLDMLEAERSARVIATDSGGIQKEAYWLGVPCVTMRDETEWSETVKAGWNVLSGADAGRIASLLSSINPPTARPVLYGGDGKLASRCVSILERFGS